MGVAVTTRVWQHSKQDESNLVALLALADWADEDGISWYDIEKIAARVRKSIRQTQRIIKALEDSGELYRQVGRGRGNTSTYAVLCGLNEAQINDILSRRFGKNTQTQEKVSPTTPIKKVTSSTPLSIKGDIQGTEKVTSGEVLTGARAYDPSLDPSDSKTPPQTPPFPEAPKGFKWISSSDSDQPEAHLTNGGILGPVLCKRSIAHRNFYQPEQKINKRQPCQACLAEAMERSKPKTVDPSQSSEVKDAFAKLCKMDWTIDGNASDMGKALRSLNGKATIEALRRFYVNWHKCDWRGKQGQAPKPRQVVEHWVEYTESDDCIQATGGNDDYITVEVKAEWGIDNWVERNVHKSKLDSIEWRPIS